MRWEWIWLVNRYQIESIISYAAMSICSYVWLWLFFNRISVLNSSTHPPPFPPHCLRTWCTNALYIFSPTQQIAFTFYHPSPYFSSPSSALPIVTHHFHTFTLTLTPTLSYFNLLLFSLLLSSLILSSPIFSYLLLSSLQVSKGCLKAIEILELEFPDLTLVAISGNMCTDKKPSAINW